MCWRVDRSPVVDRGQVTLVRQSIVTMICLVLLIAPIVFTQLFVGIRCAQRFPSTRFPASLLVIVTPLQLVAVVFGFEILWYIKDGPSSYDPIGDGYEIIFQYMCLLVEVAVLSCILFVWVAFSIRGAHQSRKTD